MNIAEMHTAFRVLSQQTGLHLVRGIIPETIDVFINMEIDDFINRELMQNAVVETEDNSNYKSISVSSINTFKTLHCKETITLSNNSFQNKTCINTLNDINPMFILKANLVNNKNEIISCRIVNPDLAETMLNDYCSSPDINNPIITFCNINENKEFSYKSIIYCNDRNAKFTNLILDYIKYPSVVKFVSNDSKDNVNCDLPQSLHYTIVKGAVKRFYDTLQSSVYDNKQKTITK